MLKTVRSDLRTSCIFLILYNVHILKAEIADYQAVNNTQLYSEKFVRNHSAKK